MIEPPAPTARERIAALDIVRGIAVMGIFSVNVVGMAMIEIAYFYPPAFGFDGFADKLMWTINFILVDGKFRSLFSMLFGASMVLVIERAIAAGRSPAKTHYARMIVLMAFGLLHFSLLWWGDILTHYAAAGMVVFHAWKYRARTLLITAVVGFLFYAAPSFYFTGKERANFEASMTPDATAHQREQADKRRQALFPDAERLTRDRAEHETIATRFRAVVPDGLIEPFELGPLWIETLSLMLLGMAGYKSGFLTGQWNVRGYRRVAVTGLGVGLVAYALLAAYTWRSGFRPPEHNAAYGGYSPIFRPVMASGYAALIILLARPGGWLVERLAAVGRTAFSNYLGCTLIGLLVFYGFAGGLYGDVSRAQAWLLVPPTWLLMLAWSKPWLDRFHYGPFEWLWRSLARGRLQPLRKLSPASPLA